MLCVACPALTEVKGYTANRSEHLKWNKFREAKFFSAYKENWCNKNKDKFHVKEYQTLSQTHIPRTFLSVISVINPYQQTGHDNVQLLSLHKVKKQISSKNSTNLADYQNHHEEQLAVQEMI